MRRAAVLVMVACASGGKVQEDTDDTDASLVVPDTDVVVSEDTDAPGLDTGGDPDPTLLPGVFVALGDGGRVATSRDGETWDDHVGSGTIDATDAESLDAWRAAFSHRGTVVRVGGGRTSAGEGATTIATSADGLSWDDAVISGAPPARALRGVTGHGPVWIAVGDDTLVLRSTDDARTWSQVELPQQPIDATLRAVAAAGSDVVVVGGAFSPGESEATILVSHDLGLRWTAVHGEPGPLVSVVTNGRVWVAVSPKRCVRSADAVVWDDCGLLDTNYRGLVVQGDTISVVFKTGQAETQDGVVWTKIGASASGLPDALAVGAGAWVGLRYLQRGRSVDRLDWSWASWTDAPMRTVVFHPAP